MVKKKIYIPTLNFIWTKFSQIPLLCSLLIPTVVPFMAKMSTTCLSTRCQCIPTLKLLVEYPSGDKKKKICLHERSHPTSLLLAWDIPPLDQLSIIFHTGQDQIAFIIGWLTSANFGLNRHLLSSPLLSMAVCNWIWRGNQCFVLLPEINHTEWNWMPGLGDTYKSVFQSSNSFVMTSRVCHFSPGCYSHTAYSHFIWNPWDSVASFQLRLRVCVECTVCVVQ